MYTHRGIARRWFGVIKLAAATVVAASVAACGGSSSSSGDNDDDPGTGSGVRAGMAVWDADFVNYYVSSDSIMEGTISAVGNGVEGFPGPGALRVGNYLYTKCDDWCGTDTIDQWELTGTDSDTAARTPSGTPTKSLAWSSVCEGCGGYGWTVVDNNGQMQIVITRQFGWDSDTPDADNNLPGKWTIINIPQLEVAGQGAMDVPMYQNGDDLQRPGWPGLSFANVSGNYAYFGTTYGNPWDPDAEVQNYNTPNSMVTLRYDWPLTDGAEATIIENPITSGDGTGWVGGMSWTDEAGDVYQINLLSKGWWDYGSKQDEQDTFVLKIDGSTGQYDTTYAFNIDAQVDHTVSITQATYMGEGIVMALLQNEDNYDDWEGMYTGNHARWVILDVVNQTLQEVPGIPTFPGGYFYGGFQRGDFYYVPVAQAGENPLAYVYAINWRTGELTQGAVIDGGNLSAVQLVDHN
ncbi:MAG: hypothetical protein AAF434_03190 [Pseudomonadota bacterium]